MLLEKFLNVPDINDAFLHAIALADRLAPFIFSVRALDQ